MRIAGHGRRSRSTLLRRGALAVAGCGLASALLVGHAAVSPTIAFAACHHFTVKATPTTVPEGGKVTITVSRDGNLAPSNVDVSTVDETAKGGQDYQPFHKTFSFTNETQQTDTVQTLNDQQPGSDKTFRLHLSNPGGCAVNPNYVLDPDARVTVQETTAAATSAASAPSPSARALAAGTPNSGAPSANQALVAVSIVAILVVLAGGWLTFRRRATG